MRTKREPVTLDAAGEVINPAPRRTPAKINLSTLHDLRREMARVYRDARAGRIETQDASRLTYMLGELVKVQTVIDLEARLNRLEADK